MTPNTTTLERHGRRAELGGETAIEITTPIGPLTLVASEEALTGVYFAGHARARVPAHLANAGALLKNASAQLAAYFAGTRASFDLPLAPQGTAFQRAVWAELAGIPHAETRSYRDIARAIGRPDAMRAVGAANGKNPLSIVVPCHRVIGSDASLTGYAGGLPAKKWLLAHERAARTS